MKRIIHWWSPIQLALGFMIGATWVWAGSHGIQFLGFAFIALFLVRIALGMAVPRNA